MHAAGGYRIHYYQMTDFKMLLIFPWLPSK